MNRDDRRLMRHLATAVVVKLIVLVVLWWLFVPHAVPTGSEQTAAHLAAPVHPAAGELPHSNNISQETAP